MRKPSIFSNNYAKRMKKRKIKYAIIIVVIIAILFALFFRSNILNIKHESTITNNKGKSAQIPTPTPKPTPTPAKVEEKSYTVDLSNGKQIRLVYEEKDNNKIFKYVSPIDSGVVTDISPSQKAIVILDSNQDILYYDIEGKKKDLTKREHSSSKGVIFTKENELNKNPSYTWHGSPKFLDEGTIAYVSELPYFNNVIKYVWNINVKNGEHIQFSEKFSSENLSLGELNEKGLIVKTKDKTYYLKSDGSSTE